MYLYDYWDLQRKKKAKLEGRGSENNAESKMVKAQLRMMMVLYAAAPKKTGGTNVLCVRMDRRDRVFNQFLDVNDKPMY